MGLAYARRGRSRSLSAAPGRARRKARCGREAQGTLERLFRSRAQTPGTFSLVTFFGVCQRKRPARQGRNQAISQPRRRSPRTYELPSTESNIEHRTSNIEHRTSNIEHRTSNIEHRTPNTEHRTPSIEHRASSVERRASSVDASMHRARARARARARKRRRALRAPRGTPVRRGASARRAPQNE